jgi:mannose-1-phosphate guanylyltransferase
MKAVILAGGKGLRARPMTETVPKPMMTLINRPVMVFLIELLRDQGFDEIVISTSYLAHEIENYFRDGRRFGVQLAYSFEGYHRDGVLIDDGLGAAGGLKKIQQHSGFLDDTFAVVSCDAIMDLDFGPAIAFHRARRSIATLLLRDVARDDVSKYGVVRTDADGRILEFQEKPRPHQAISTTINTGVYLFEPEALDYIPSDQPVDIAREFFPRLAERQLPFYGIAMPFTWIDIGRTEDYWRATQMIMDRRITFIDIPGQEIAPGVWTGINVRLDPRQCHLEGPIYIGSSTQIDPGARILGPTVIGRNCQVEGGAVIDKCVVADYTRVSGLAAIREKIVSGRFCVDRYGYNVDLARTGYAFVVDDVRERRQWTDEQESLMSFLKAQAGTLQDAGATGTC